MTVGNLTGIARPVKGKSPSFDKRRPNAAMRAEMLFGEIKSRTDLKFLQISVLSESVAGFEFSD
jgi:hypothetical protein